MTKVLGVIGCPINHSLSPIMHNTAISKLGLNYIYLPFHVKPSSLEDAVKGMKALGITGFNVTVPHKIEIIKYLDAIDENANFIGAVNTVKLENNKFTGYNTDGQGFYMSLTKEKDTNVTDKNILILGAGGAARAVAVYLATKKPKGIVILNRTKERADDLNAHISSKLPSASITAGNLDSSTLNYYIPLTDIIINATSMGLKENSFINFPYNLLNNKHIVCDLVYNPPMTDFLKKADNAGADVLPGLGMLLYQGDIAFNIWTGTGFPINDISNVLMKTIL